MNNKYKSEQIDKNGKIIIYFDQPITKRLNFLEILNNSLNFGVKEFKYKNKTVFFYMNNNIKYYFICASVTYLGNPHPIFKKRIQLKSWYNEFINEYQSNETKIYIFGIYKYNDNVLFCDFKITDYINNKLNSSSAHVYINDLYQGLTYNISRKLI
ncbi:hypothetical protein [Mycoplasmopsis felis]|uniref:hypothetical protein n=1 Tax=Mycoplasmopsis felis TaxID=33923 RepID=UPI002AFE4140|nr:hypothetical protein [Mycoplasmopsis felis]WQQ04655.1 hypothetical protein RRG55_03675 [Mycoplasmopsis felis]